VYLAAGKYQPVFYDPVISRQLFRQDFVVNFVTYTRLYTVNVFCNQQEKIFWSQVCHTLVTVNKIKEIFATYL